MNLKNKKAQEPSEGIVIVAIIFVIICGVALSMWILPQYNVWKSAKSGEAHLKEAEYSRQIAVVEAEAKLVSAGKLAEAEVARAKGVAQANEIIAGSITEPYLRYLYVQGIIDSPSEKQIIYVPTEAGLPILEAQRLK